MNESAQYWIGKDRRMTDEKDYVFKYMNCGGCGESLANVELCPECGECELCCNENGRKECQ